MKIGRSIAGYRYQKLSLLPLGLGSNTYHSLCVNMNIGITEWLSGCVGNVLMKEENREQIK